MPHDGLSEPSQDDADEPSRQAGWDTGTWERGALRECGTIQSDGAEVWPVGLGYRIGIL